MRTHYRLLAVVASVGLSTAVNPACGQAPPFLWAEQGAGSDVAADGFANCYSASGSLLKYDAGGEILWSKGAGVNRVAVDASGNIYATADFSGTPGATFKFDNLIVSNRSGSGFLVVKYAADGTLSWLRQADSTGGTSPTGIAVAASGGVFVTGFNVGASGVASGSLSFAGLTVSNSFLFVAKYDSGGSLLWAKSGQTNWYSQGDAREIATDQAGNCVVRGAVAGGTLVAKYDSNGNLLWSKVGVGANDHGGVAVDGQGNSYVGTGLFGGTNTLTFDTVTVSGPGGVVAKFDPDGHVLWAKAFGTSDLVHGFALVTADPAGNCYAAICEITPSSEWPPIDYFYILKLDPQANVLWQTDNVGDAAPDAVGIDPEGDVYFTGHGFANSVIFGNIAINAVHPSFVGKLGNPNTAPVLKAAVSGGSLVISWPVSATNFTMQSTASLVAPVWTTNAPAPVVVNGQNTVTNSISGAQKFFRLSL